MKKILILLIIPCILSCNSNEVREGIKKQEVSNQEPIVLKMDDPALFLGTDFMTFFQTCYRLGDYDKMIKFTYSKDVKKHGYKNLKEFYKTIDFNYKISILSKNETNDSIILNYESQRSATRGAKRFIVKIENDSCKVVLPNNLNNF